MEIWWRWDTCILETLRSKQASLFRICLEPIDIVFWCKYGSQLPKINTEGMMEFEAA